MADYDQPGISWVNISKATPNPEFYRDELDFVSVNPEVLPGINPNLVNAFGTFTGGGGGGGETINGYGYGHSG